MSLGANMKHPKLIVFLILLILFVRIVAAEEMILTPTDNGIPVTVEHGDKFTVRLPATSGTGYTWTMTLSKGLQLVSKKTIPAKKPGGTQYQEFKIKAVGSGQQSLKAVYKRSGEKKSKKTFGVKIDVI
jgi:predicted secreted protein